MGIEPYLISSSVAAVMAQRLVRVICPDCRSETNITPQIASMWNEEAHMLTSDSCLFEGTGCDNCLNTGYVGRTGVFELLTIDDDIKELIIERSGSHVIKDAAVAKGMSTLRRDGLRKALAGETTIDEIQRVTQDSITSCAGAV
jgi:general secretion pathway protein E